ncbi:MAG TPA: sugar phosphate nucleotidyltransferase [Mycobacteriales bacterium]
MTRTLVIVLAGGAGSRLGPLTDGRAKPAVPFAGTFRLIDFPLSNCLHSGISDVWVVQQHHPESLTDHLANGRPWDLDRTYGGLLVLHPRLGEKGGFHQGTADALWRNAGLVREFGPDALVLVSADAVYRADYGRIAARHLDRDADLTIVTTEVDPDDACRYGVVQVDGDRVTDYAYKPEEPAASLVANEVFVLRPDAALAALDEAAEELGPDAVEDGELADLGDTLLPRLVAGGGAVQHRLESYWRDVGTIEAYWAAHRDLLGDEPRLDLDDPRWPVRTHDAQRPPARLRPASSVADSLVSPACVVHGTVTGSVLGPGVRVEEDAVVTDSVLHGDVVVRAGARVTRAVLDERTEVGAGARVGRSRGGITVTARDDRVGPEQRREEDG